MYHPKSCRHVLPFLLHWELIEAHNNEISKKERLTIDAYGLEDDTDNKLINLNVNERISLQHREKNYPSKVFSFVLFFCLPACKRIERYLKICFSFNNNAIGRHYKQKCREKKKPSTESQNFLMFSKCRRIPRNIMKYFF